MYAAQTRARARLSLKGNWPKSIGTALMAALLGVGGGSAGSTGYGAGNAGYGDSASSYGVVGGTGWLNGLDPFLRNIVFGVGVSVLAFMAVYAVVTLIIGGAVRLGLYKYNIDLVLMPENARFATLFSRFRIFGRAFLLQLAMGLFVFLWSLLFVIPGIIAAYRYAMAPYIMAQNPDIGVMEAIRQSKQLMAGNKWRLFCLGFSFIGWAFLAALTFGIGALWLNPYIYAAEAVFYLDLTGQLGAPAGGGFAAQAPPAGPQL